MIEEKDYPGIVTDSGSIDKTAIETMVDEMIAVEMLARETELHAAWRAGYDFLYVLSNFDMRDLTLEFIPSNDSDCKFKDSRVERYDLREENLPPEAMEILMKFKP